MAEETRRLDELQACDACDVHGDVAGICCGGLTSFQIPGKDSQLPGGGSRCRILLNVSLDLDRRELRLLEDLSCRAGRAPAFGLVAMISGDHTCPATSSTRTWGREETGGLCGARCGPTAVGRTAFVRAWALLVAGLGAGEAW